MAASTDVNQLFGDKKIPFSVFMKKIFRYIKPELPKFILALFIMAISVGINIVLPLIMSHVTETISGDVTLPHVIFNLELKTLVYLIILAAGYFLLSLLSLVCLYFQTMVLQKVGQRIVYELRLEVFAHVENMSLNQLNMMPVGSLVTRVASYTANMSNLFTNTLVQILSNILTIVGVYIAMLTISGYLSLIILAIAVVIFVASYVFAHFVKKLFSKERGYVSDMNTYLNESFTTMKVIQIFNQEKRKEREFVVKNEQLRKARYSVTMAFAFYRPFISFLYVVAVALTFYCGIEFALTIAEVVAFYLYLSRFFNPVETLADSFNEVQRAMTTSERLFNLLDVEPEVLDKEDAVDVDHFVGKIEFRGVWFAYNEGEWILKDVSFVIDPRTTVAFVGATGAGKTTILSLLVRNYEPQKGQILIDDIDISTMKIDSLRKKIGQMLQDVFLFSGNIRTNITLYDESYSDKEINDAIDYVNARSFVDKLDHGLDEEVLEKGNNFSSGQRQLISFARTVLTKPEILILDEATSNIDTETEVIIQQSLENMKNIGTMLIVAHRLSTIQKADQIICLQNGEIVEKGTHQSLLKKKGYYYKLYLLQFDEGSH